MSSIRELKAAVVEVQDQALHGSELMHAAGEKASDLGTRLQGIVTRLGEIGVEVNGVLWEMEFDVELPVVGGDEYAKIAHNGIVAAAEGTNNPKLQEAVALLGKAATASGSSKTAAHAVRQALHTASLTINEAASMVEGLPGATIGDPGDDGTEPFGVASLASVSGERMISGIVVLDEWLPSV